MVFNFDKAEIFIIENLKELSLCCKDITCVYAYIQKMYTCII